MVHEKYIKRGNKVFGPYLYTNYREGGKTKTKYFGKAKKKSLLTRKLFIILGIVFLVLVLIFLFANQMFLNFESLKGILPSEKFFSIFVNITANDLPEVLNLSEEILVCENHALSAYFNVSDGNGDILTLGYHPPLGIYLFFAPNPTLGEIVTRMHMFTGRLLTAADIYRPGRREDNEGWAVYPQTITATDGIAVGSANTNIIIIEVNDPPRFDISVQTIYTKGEQTNFYYDLGYFLMANWEETPEEDLIFNLTFLEGESIFNLSDYGVINVTGNESFIEAGENSTTYLINITVQDDGLRSIEHENISICYQYGLNEDPKNWSDYFYLTVTRENRPPNITSYSPVNLSLDVRGTELLYFNATAYDPDWTPLDVYWYVDDVEKNHIEGLGVNNLTKFEHVFDCGVSGNHTVKIVVTDGLANASVQWNLSVEYVSCSISPSRKNGGGGPRGLYCLEKWGCEEWTQCENREQGFKFGKINKEQRLLIKERCKLFNYAEDVCGFQTRKCTDFNYCNTIFNRPGIIRECYYTEHPNCTDGIKNCHHGSCEILVDCGGPCEPCPTCDDGICNQNEDCMRDPDLPPDCGGVCEPCKEFPLKPRLIKMLITYSLLALLVLVLILALRQILKYKKYKKEVKKEKKKQQKYVGGFVFLLFAIVLLFFANIFMTNVAQKDRIVIEVDEDGILGSQALTNIYVSTMRNLARLFRTEIILVSMTILDDTKLSIWDDTELGIRRSGWDVYFYANYTNDTTRTPFSTGNCNIQFQDSNYIYGPLIPMIYNTPSLLFEYNRSFDYKGTYDFNVSCSYGGIFIDVEDDFTITNSIPLISKEQGADWINFDGNPQNHDAWQCVEDTLCYYNFSANVSDLDTNDVLFYSYETVNTTLTDYLLNDSTGMLEINITHSNYSGPSKKIQLGVKDNDPESLTQWALLDVDIQEVNDPPFFINLYNQTFNAQDLFEYMIYVGDEEWDVPFVFNISFVDCTVANCTLIEESDYTVDGYAGWINISFSPSLSDVGIYTLNFSVMDNSSLGNQTTSVLVNFTVTVPIWNEPALILGHNLIEDGEFFLNLTEMILDAHKPTVSFSFSNNTFFPNFNLTSEGVINFTPSDVDVGFHEVDITATSGLVKSSRIFNFTVQNIDDNVSIFDLEATGVINITQNGRFNITAYENEEINLWLYIEDDDFLIFQKDFYDESITINLTIQGPNPNLFEFVFDSWAWGNSAKYIAPFKPMELEEGYYNIGVNVTDANNFSSDFLGIDLMIYDRNYTAPNITYPNKSVEFNLKENRTFDLVFRANHSVGDNLSYNFYINDELRDSLNYYGDGRNLVWQFSPNFTDETYGEVRNLTLLVLNPYFCDLNDSRTWNLTINHTNAPVQFLDDVDPIVLPYNYALEVDLKPHFFDIDHEDNYYSQNVSFMFLSNSTPSQITISEISEEWTFILSSEVYSPFSERLNIIACDLNESNGNVSNMTCITSNNFTVEFISPEHIPVPVPTPSPTKTRKTVISLKIIMPREISAYEGEKIEIPLLLENKGDVTFNNLNLTSIAFKDANISSEVRTSLDKTHFNALRPGQTENLTLTVFFDTDKIGDYEILVNATSNRPKYTDWNKIHINLQRINETRVRELIFFTEELIVQNPACMEIMELVDQAKEYFEREDFTNARLKAEQAITACEESISQPTLLKKREVLYGISLYLVLAIASVFVVSVVYYLLKRRKFQKMKNT